MLDSKSRVIRCITWEDAMPIRHQVLWPTKSPKFCRVEGDESAQHYGVYIGDDLVSVASIYITGNTARLRKFATLEAYQGQGIGSDLLRYVLNDIAKSDVNRFWCDARASAAVFYKKFGLQQAGNKFYKVDIPYYKMSAEI